MSAHRTLLLLRHAKSSWDDPDLDDFDRPLNRRGSRDAPRIGKWVEATDYRPACVVCSPARRTRDTWAAVADQLPGAPEPIYQPELYHASEKTIVDIVRGLPQGCHTAMLIGHNPGIGDAMRTLAADGPEEDMARLGAKVPTGALAILRWRGEWGDAGRGIATLLQFVRPKDL